MLRLVKILVDRFMGEENFPSYQSFRNSLNSEMNSEDTDFFHEAWKRLHVKRKINCLKK